MYVCTYARMCVYLYVSACVRGVQNVHSEWIVCECKIKYALYRCVHPTGDDWWWGVLCGWPSGLSTLHLELVLCLPLSPASPFLTSSTLYTHPFFSPATVAFPSPSLFTSPFYSFEFRCKLWRFYWTPVPTWMCKVPTVAHRWWEPLKVHKGILWNCS